VTTAGQRGQADLIPIVVGVTGHRDLRPEDRPGLEEAVRSVFTILEREYPSSPLLLLSALAEGADRLAARVALDRGIPLFVPLPFDRSQY
jgi:hypothetical protein